MQKILIHCLWGAKYLSTRIRKKTNKIDHSVEETLINAPVYRLPLRKKNISMILLMPLSPQQLFNLPPMNSVYMKNKNWDIVLPRKSFVNLSQKGLPIIYPNKLPSHKTTTFVILNNKFPSHERKFKNQKTLPFRKFWSPSRLYPKM